MSSRLTYVRALAPAPRGGLRMRMGAVGRPSLATVTLGIAFVSGCEGETTLAPAPSAIVASEVFHDFGSVDIGSGGQELGHTFFLTNGRDSTANVRDIKSTCGCAVADLEKRTIEPGETISLAAKLRLRKRGKRTERLTVLFEDAEPLRLTLSALAYQEQGFLASHEVVDLVRAERAIVIISWFSEQMLAPPAPQTVEHPSGLIAEVGEWRAVAEADADRSTRWHAIVKLSRDPETVLAGSKMSMLFGDYGRIDLRLDGSAW